MRGLHTHTGKRQLQTLLGVQCIYSSAVRELISGGNREDAENGQLPLLLRWCPFFLFFLSPFSGSQKICSSIESVFDKLSWHLCASSLILLIKFSI